MRQRRRAFVVGGLALLVAITLASLVVWRSVGAPGPPLSLRVVANSAISGNTGRLDYESLDEPHRLLFIAHLGDNSVIAFDTKRNRVAATIAGTDSVRGVLVVPSLQRVYAAAAGTHEVIVIDEASDKVIERITAGDVDGLAYDPQTQQVFVSDESGETDAVIHARTNTLRTHIALGGQAGNTQYDDRSHHIFVAVQTRNDLAESIPRRLRSFDVTRFRVVCIHMGCYLTARTGTRTSPVSSIVRSCVSICERKQSMRVRPWDWAQTFWQWTSASIACTSLPKAAS